MLMSNNFKKSDSLIPGLVVLKLAGRSAGQQDTESRTNQQQAAPFIRLAVPSPATVPRHDRYPPQQLQPQTGQRQQPVESAASQADPSNSQTAQQQLQCSSSDLCCNDTRPANKRSQTTASQSTSRIPVPPVSAGGQTSCKLSETNKQAAKTSAQQDRQNLQKQVVHVTNNVSGTAPLGCIKDSSKSKFLQHCSSGNLQQRPNTPHHLQTDSNCCGHANSSSKSPTSPRKQSQGGGLSTPRNNSSSCSGLQLQPELAAFLGPGPVLSPAMQQHKDRRRAELYALNAILARSDAIRVQEFLSSRQQQQQQQQQQQLRGATQSSPQSQTSQLPGGMHHGV